MKSMLKLTLPFFVIFFIALTVYTVKVHAVVTPEPFITNNATPTPPTDPPTTPGPTHPGPTIPVTAPPGPAPGCGNFQDVPSNDPFYTYVQCLGCNGSISGYQCGAAPAPACVPPANLPYFLPGNDVTRGQLTKLVAMNAHYTDQIPNDRQTFHDVAPGSTFWLYVEQAFSHGVINGYPCVNDTAEPCDSQNRPYFRPNVEINRGQAMKIVILGMGIEDNLNPPIRPTFADVPTTHTFYLYIEAAAARGLITGYPCVNGTTEPCDPQNRPYFRPADNLTRGQSSKVVALGFNCALQGTPVPPPSSCDRSHGDVDCSTTTDLVDYLYYVRYAAGVRTFPPYVSVDVNSDGQVNNTDRAIIISGMRSHGDPVPGPGHPPPIPRVTNEPVSP